jgi:CheY-like chemotaxis protein
VSRVLIIEDNPVNLELVVGILDSAGYEFVTAETAECGLQAARMERPDVVVLDVHLPGVSG